MTVLQGNDKEQPTRYNDSFARSIALGKTSRTVLASLLVLQVGCTYKTIECPAAIPGGYYNAYTNSNAAILYKRPSSKFGCWLSPCGWDCRRR